YAGTTDCTQRTADADNGEEPSSLLLRVNFVGERPKLRDKHQVEEPDPQKKHDTQRHVQPAQEIEDGEIRCEEGGHTVDQSSAIKPARNLSIERNEKKKDKRTSSARIGFDFRTTVSEDQ